MRVFYMKLELLIFRELIGSTEGFCGVRVAHLFSFICVFSVFCAQYCLYLWIVHSALPVALDCSFLVACISGLFILRCLYLWIVHSWLPVSLDCSFLVACISGLFILRCLYLWIVHSWLPVSLDCSFSVALLLFFNVHLLEK